MKDDMIPTYCRASDISALSQSALNFLESLNLPKIHPRCEMDWDPSEDLPLPDSEMAPHYFYENRVGWFTQIITYVYIAVPALLAMTELWFRLFSFFIAPMVLTYLITLEMRIRNIMDNIENVHKESKSQRNEALLTIIGIGSSIVLFTDTSYVHSYGRYLGGTMLLTVVILTLRRISTYSAPLKGKCIGAIVALLTLTMYLCVHSDRAGSDFFDHPGIDVPTIQPGLYFNQRNQFVSKIIDHWPSHHRTYDSSVCKSLFPTGDALTGIPFLVNSSSNQKYFRVWVPSEVDKEAVALDIAFPLNGQHNTDKPIYLILHGLNGGSHEEYVRELVVRRTNEGFTCVVMIARGMMDTPVFGWNVFHGARISDVDTSAKLLRKALKPGQLLVGVGYSMGGIILSNYVARSGSSCHLDAAVAVSAGLDLRENLNFFRSMRLWQPILAQGLKQDFIINKFDGRFRQRLIDEMDYEKHLFLMRATSVSDIDIHGIVTYNGYRDLLHYYTEMSAMGDTNVFSSHTTKASSFNHDIGRIGNVSIPFLVIHALDDPITTWRTMGHHPSRLVDSGFGNIIMLLTSSGGHVGWPLGCNPRISGWFWMSNAIATFIDSVDRTSKRV